ncbi:MAG: hypothetical protein J7K26_01975 [Candidatus Aenigmarchaeota archaeon]|nr:hypothetical protein [Candidatus Aenigmarchaeota archaeon]
MKGQAYTILAIFLVVSLLSLSLLFKENHIEKTNIQSIFLNVKNEIIKTVELSILDDNDISTNLDDFILFLNKYLESRNYNIETKYTINTDKVEIYLKISDKNSYIQDKFNINRKIL